jgi:general secretion pathway protein E
MMIAEHLSDVDLEPISDEGIDYQACLKHALLFTEYEGVKYAVVKKERLAEGLNYLARLGLDLPPLVVDEASFERLRTKYLEIQRSSEFANMSAETTEELIGEEADLLEFIRNSQDLLSDEASAPIVKLVNSLFFQAIQKGASDIHIESMERFGVVRFRIDGALKKHIDLEKRVLALVINRIKVISDLDIAERRIPQDGRTQIEIAKKRLDVRVSVLPTYYGERIVMRILAQSEHIPTLESLGFPDILTKKLYKLLNHSHGMLLVTGPTGSGKSTTLHACLQHIATPDKNIITVEDPVEYNADNIAQIQVNEKVGLTFSAGLRSILRQDPDIIMVGEIRDSETAQIALRAALTGHLLLSTLHTNDATSAISRLVDMGIENYLISSTLLGVLAQRLARKLCNACKEPVVLEDEIMRDFDLPESGNYYRAKGCGACDFTGYSGRKVVGELFIIDAQVKDMIKEGTNDYQIREILKQQGMQTLSDALRTMVIAGETSYEEAIRVGLMDG